LVGLMISAWVGAWMDGWAGLDLGWYSFMFLCFRLIESTVVFVGAGAGYRGIGCQVTAGLW
jgi:hypothetical protein